MGSALGRQAARTAGSTRARLEVVLGGPNQTRIILVLAAVLALSSADAATVGASATELRRSLHIGNAGIGLLVSVTAAVGAVASLPFGVLVDRVRRVPMLVVTTALWGVVMVASATVSTFGSLLLVRVFLGFVTAVAGPAVASLVGDYVPSDQRGKVYGYILSGELLGGGVGFFISGDVAAISWRLAFLVLSLPAFVLAWQLHKLPEPARRGRTGAADRVGNDLPSHPPPEAGEQARRSGGPGVPQFDLSLGQRIARDQGVQADPTQVLTLDPKRMGLLAAARYVLSIRTNVVLIVSSACAYFFMTGIQTFGLEFVGRQYGVHTFLANLLLLVVGVGAILGVLVGGPLGDALVRRGRINGQMLVAGVAALATTVLFVPALITHSPVSAVPYIALAAFFLTAQNPTLDAARLDIMPPLLWGRAEGIRTFLRQAAQSLAPVTFGGLADLFGHQGLRITFFIMLLPLLASGVILLRGLGRYPTDVATAAASMERDPGGALRAR